MHTVKDITTAIQRLPRKDFFRVAKWVKKRSNDEWDKEFEEDVKAGLLDKLAERALAEDRVGKPSETAYLLRSPANRRRLLAAIAELEQYSKKRPHSLKR